MLIPELARRRTTGTTPPLPPTPYLALDVPAAVDRYRVLSEAFGSGAVHYAVKANPHPALLAALAATGARFDVAGATEVEACLTAGSPPHHLLCSNPMMRRTEIDHAHRRGVRTFVADSPGEVRKLAAAAPGAQVLARLSTSGAGSDWPLSGKFGCSPEDAYALLVLADSLGLRAAGVAFHVGSQQREPARWTGPVAEAALLVGRLRRAGLRPWLLDVGGGLPADHEGGHPALGAYVGTILDAVAQHFPDRPPQLVVEPGRGVVGDAGTLHARVLGVTWRGGRRWVYLDAGVYSGLVETLGESIRYRLSTDRDGDPAGPAVLAGPTCDSVDVLYEDEPVVLPLTLREGDQVRFGAAGAYTTTYATVGFNGFAPLPTVLV